MSTSFREEALLRAWAAIKPHAGEGVDQNEADARAAQDLADAACRVWGHDVRAVQPLEIGGATIALRDLNRLPAHTECARCGKRGTDT